MICKNCNSEISDDSEYCPVCNVYASPYKLETMEVIDNYENVLLIDDDGKFNLQIDNKNEILAGRADVNSSPDIDLGPYDKGPYVSRKHGVFFWETGRLYYKDVSKNGSYINGKKIKQNEKILLNNGDSIVFGSVKGIVKLNY